MAVKEALATQANAASRSIFRGNVLASCPPSLPPTKTPPGFCVTISGLAGSASLTEVITGMVLKAGSRLRIEASPDRARINAKVQNWAPRGDDELQESGARTSEGPEERQHACRDGGGSPRWRNTV